MKRRKSICIFSICFLALLAGCGRETDERGMEPEDTADAAWEEEEPGQGNMENESYPRDLTGKELQEYTAWMHQRDNYGFLLSEYNKPEDIDLDEVFYSGAGLEMEPLNEAEEKTFLEAIGQEEIYTDTMRLTLEQVQEFVFRKTGVPYVDMADLLSWIYLGDYEIYICEHGDTNYMDFTCVSGRQTDTDIFELDYMPGREEDLMYIPSGRLTVRKNGDEYQFISNVYADRISDSGDVRKIEEQCFDVELEGWGEVTFTSYAPDQSVDTTGDAVFELEKDGEKQYRFPCVMKDNQRSGETFVQVQAVSFQDYDGDKNKDVIVITEYEPKTNASDGWSHMEVRLYRNRPEEQEFALDTERMDVLNKNQWNSTVKEVMEHMGEAERRKMLSYLTDMVEQE